MAVAGGTLALYLDTLEFRQARCLLTMLRLSLTIERQAHHCVTSWWISLAIALWTTPHRQDTRVQTSLSSLYGNRQNASAAGTRAFTTTGGASRSLKLRVSQDRRSQLINHVQLHGRVFLEPPLNWYCRFTRDIYIEVGALSGAYAPKRISSFSQAASNF